MRGGAEQAEGREAAGLGESNGGTDGGGGSGSMAALYGGVEG